ncbi:MAG: Ig-like domain-containing protein [Sinobacteraceae bacterium]|nr:Ig-like domain-containing protein [Nevskiaceae bacterium]
MKRILLTLAALGAAGALHAQTSTYTLADVAKHATAADCWMVLNSTKVYNVSAFIPAHPGGNAMVPYCGKDGTQAFNNVGHSSNAVAMEATYLIGTLVSAPVPITVQITPTNATVDVGGTVHFVPTITNSTAGVAWTLSPSNLGTISSSGLFTAVAAGSGTVTATSAQDMTKSASATITVNTAPASPPPAHTITVAVTPSALSVNVGAKAQFTAQLTNSTQGVTWSAAAAVGTIDASGKFTAAMTPGTGMVTATSMEDPTKSHAVQVTVTPVQCNAGSGSTDGSSDGHPHHRHDD